MTYDMNEQEYLFMCGHKVTFPEKLYQAVGEYCYEEGWIDLFGFPTAKGEKAVREYERQTSV